MTRSRKIALSSRVGRRKEFDQRVTLPLSAEMLERIDACLDGDEARLDMIRAAIWRELKRRERRTRKPADE